MQDFIKRRIVLFHTGGEQHYKPVIFETVAQRQEPDLLPHAVLSFCQLFPPIDSGHAIPLPVYLGAPAPANATLQAAIQPRKQQSDPEDKAPNYTVGKL